MSDGIKLKISENGIAKFLNGMLQRSSLVKGWLNRVAYPTIIRVQRQRWITEGNSEGYAWKQLSPNYEKYKLRKFADYPGGGRKLLIATNRLVDSMTGDNQSEHYKLVTDKTLEVGTFVPYAKYVDEQRSIVKLSPETVAELKDGLKKYLTKGT